MFLPSIKREGAKNHQAAGESRENKILRSKTGVVLITLLQAVEDVRYFSLDIFPNCIPKWRGLIMLQIHAHQSFLRNINIMIGFYRKKNQ